MLVPKPDSESRYPLEAFCRVRSNSRLLVAVSSLRIPVNEATQVMKERLNESLWSLYTNATSRNSKNSFTGV